MQAFRLHQQLSEALQRRDEWREKDKETPQEERERLLQQVKADNQEIGSIEKLLDLMKCTCIYGGATNSVREAWLCS